MYRPMSDVDLELKKGFRELFPEYASQLEKAKSDSDIEGLRQNFVHSEIEKLTDVLDEETLKLLSADGGLTYAMTPQEYSNMINARGDNIKLQITTLLNTLKAIKNIPDPTTGQTAAMMLATGIGAISTGIGVFNAALGSGAAVAAAAALGVEAVTVAGIVGLIAVAIIAALIPIIYFMSKPAACFVFVINEIPGHENQITLGDRHCVHGKEAQLTPQISGMITIPAGVEGSGNYPVGGFVVSEKDSSALIGSQYGFQYKLDDTVFSFGVECPLTGIYVDNNCYCAFGGSAETAANNTNSDNKQSYSASNSDYIIDINCNSGSGSVAYYIARVRPSKN